MRVSTFSVGPASGRLLFQVAEIDEGASWAMVRVTMIGDPPVSRLGDGKTKIDAAWDALEGIVPALITDQASRFYREVKKQLATLFIPSIV